ncbi:MAG: hydantoinase B/oxoprolinase family protein [Chloroflexi bacterium]|nr:hydantoinase B/oxoprolinase family protein [Chloroflexota bacterium]
MVATGPNIDPITLEVLRSAFAATCNEMALVVGKTAYSPPINEGRDLATGIYDRHGALVSQGEFDLPAFVGLTHLTVPEVIRSIGLENMQPGDIYMINDPYVASTHNNDIHFIKPIFHDGSLIAFTSSTAHWSDVGGVSPGSLNPRARSHFEEGMRIPALTIYKQNVLDTDIVGILLANMRQGWERLGDLQAQVAAVRGGERRILALVAKHGSATVLAAMEEIQHYSERLARAAFRALPDGVYYAEDSVDQDLWTGEPKTVRLTLTIEDDHAVFDFLETDGAAESGINCTIAGTTSGVFIAMGSILPPMPMNAGVMRAIVIKAKRGSIVWAQPPSGISAMAITTMECVMGSVTLALGQAAPKRGVGLAGALLNITYAGSDERPEFDAPFINYTWGFGGMGGAYDHDGANYSAAPYASSAMNIPCELQERRYPVLYRRCDLTQNSEGPGAFRGGLGLSQQIAFPFQGGTLSNIGNRERFGPSGIFGGRTGGFARLILAEGTENEQNLGTFAVNAPVQRGDVMTFVSNGGGGYGDPLERDPARVLADVVDEYATIAHARATYGVVINEIDRRRLLFEVDEAATAELRAAMRAS